MIALLEQAILFLKMLKKVGVVSREIVKQSKNIQSEG